MGVSELLAGLAGLTRSEQSKLLIEARRKFTAPSAQAQITAAAEGLTENTVRMGTTGPKPYGDPKIQHLSGYSIRGSEDKSI